MMPIEQATISPMDRGFLFGDGVYEVMARVDGRIRAKSLHQARLQSSLDAIALSVSVDDVFADVDHLAITRRQQHIICFVTRHHPNQIITILKLHGNFAIALDVGEIT